MGRIRGNKLKWYELEKAKERFFNKVTKTDNCWLWIGGTINKGYGNFTWGRGVNILAHRFSYEIHKGKIPEGKIILHSCDNPICVNPEHLTIGTQQDNVNDMMNKNRMNPRKIISDHEVVKI